MTTRQPADRRSILALNAVSTLSQVGQYGIGFIVLPLWFAQQGLGPSRLGLITALPWVGMLAGLAVGPRWIARSSARRVVALGLACTLIAFVIIPRSAGAAWLFASTLAGLGIGLRWIALEPWLYGLVPARARGRVVGLHETLIGLAPIIAPSLVGWLGTGESAVFTIGLAFTALAALPLALARRPQARQPLAAVPTTAALAPGRPAPLPGAILALGLAIAMAGGLVEGAFTGLFPLFGTANGLGAEHIAWLLSIFGTGGLLFQYPLGWLADHRGLRLTAMLCTVGTALALAVLALPAAMGPLAVALFVLGGFLPAFLTLAMIAATDAAHDNPAATFSRITMTYTASSALGPLVGGAVMQALGGSAFVAQMELALVALAVYIAWRRHERASA